MNASSQFTGCRTPFVVYTNVRHRVSNIVLVEPISIFCCHLYSSRLRYRHSSRRLGDVVSTNCNTLSNWSGIGSGNTIERLDLRLRRVSFGVEPSPSACCRILNRESCDLK